MSTVLSDHDIEPSPPTQQRHNDRFHDRALQHAEQKNDTPPMTKVSPLNGTRSHRRHSVTEPEGVNVRDCRGSGDSDNYSIFAQSTGGQKGLNLDCASIVSSPSRQNLLRKPQFQLLLPSRPKIAGTILDGILDDTTRFIRPVLLTPPDETSQTLFNLSEDDRSNPVRSTPPTEAHTNTAIPVTEGKQPSLQTADAPMSLSQDEALPAQANEGDILSSAINLVVENVIQNSEQLSEKKMVVQVLPQPASEQDPSLPVSLFQTLLDRLLTSRPLTPRWVTAIHAVPKNYPVDGLPTSASSTPIATGLFEPQDYFAPQRGVVHTSAYMVDQYDMYTPRSGQTTPALASSPNSVDVSIYQRIIPPSTAKEVTDLFEAAPGSALTSRLQELALNGCLIFFYPTAKGAHTFKQDYLDRGLASLIRSVIMGKGLPASACASVADMEALSAMLDFDTMQEKLTKVLRDLQSWHALNGASFAIISSIRADMELPRATWKQWWIKQEQSRVKAVIERYFKQVELRGKVFHKDERYTARGIANEILRGLSHDSMEEAAATVPPEPIEVGVFVIKRNA